MSVYQGKKLKEYLQLRGVSKTDAAKKLGVSRQTLYQYFDSENLSRETVNKLLTTFNTTERQIFGESVVPRMEAIPLYQAADPNDYDNDGSKFEDLGNGMLRMRVPIVTEKANAAGYVRGYSDPEYFEGLQTVSLEVYKEHRGNYVAFEVRGDSMKPSDPADFDRMALEGWKAIGRELPRHHWQYKLHTHKTDNWVIVHRTQGIMIKTIIHHDVENGTITVHSLNPAYEDEVFHLDDIAQIFSVVKFIIDK